MVTFAPKAQNFMKNIVYDGCARPFWVYFETFVPSFVEAWITISFWDMDDLIRARAETIARKGGGGSGRGLGHAARSRIPAKGAGKERYAAKALKWLLVFTEPLEKAGFAILAYGAADQFYYRWGTLIEAVAPCNPNASAGSFQRSGSNVNWGLLETGSVAPLPSLDQNSKGWSNSGFHVDVGPGKYQFVFAANIRSHGATIPGVQIRVNTPGIVGFADWESGPSTINPDSDTSFIVVGLVFITGIFGSTITWETFGVTVPVGCIATSARFSLVGLHAITG